MRKSRFVPVVEFCKKNGISTDSIYVFKHNYANQTYKGIKKLKDGSVVIDEAYFLRRENFKTKIKMAAQENYYFLTSCISSFQLTKILSNYSNRSHRNWVMFMTVDLFSVNTSPIISTRDFKKLWEFFRLTKALIRAVFKTVGVPINKRDYNKMYDYKYGKVS